MNKKRRSPGRRLAGVVMLFYFLAFLLLALRDRDTLGFILCVSVPLLIFLGTTLLPRLFPTDRLLMSLTNFLCALGVLILYDTKPDYAIQQVLAYGVGLGGMLFCIYLVRMSRGWGRITTIIMPMALAFLAFPLLFGKEINGAQNWIVLGSLSFQPSEIVKPALVICLSWRMSSRQHLVWVLFGTLCLLLLALQRDFGTALIYFLSTILLFWCSTGHLPLTLLGLAAGGGAAWWGYQHFAHVRRRVAIWLNPWRDSENAGYQLIQGLMAIASGGLFGVGLGLGAPTSIPVYASDFIFAVICEQFGLVFGICVLLIFVALILRSAMIAVSARRRFHSLLAAGSAAMIGIQAFLIIGGVLKLIPLTGVTLPFISYGGTSLVSCLCLVGLIQGVESLNEEELEQDAHLAMLSR